MYAYKLNKALGKLRYHDLYGRGIPIVFIHGLGCTSSCDYPQVAFNLALRGRRILLIDLRGSGFSDSPIDFGYTIDDHARTIAAFIEGLEFKKITLVGHSMGGSIAIAVASLCKSKIGRLILGEPTSIRVEVHLADP
jgi:pimeloyl-ACP methyl ester carboxylesterase